MKPKQSEKKKKEVEIEHPSRNVTIVKFPYVHAGWEQWILLTSDRHHDSIYCDRELEKKHLELAKSKGAFVIDVGDVFDVMQGRYDPRRTYKELRPEYKVENYLDEIITESAKFYAPYAKNFLVIGRGNHEQSVLKNNGVDLISNLVHRLNSEAGGKIQAGYYGGWVRFQFAINGTQRVSKNLKYFHGAGGGGPVTRGVIQTNRQAVYQPDAAIILNGHTHDSWNVPIARERLSDEGVVFQDIQHHIRTSTYKDEYRDGGDGWHVETWKPPKPIGAAWLCFKVQSTDGRFGISIEASQELKQ